MSGLKAFCKCFGNVHAHRIVQNLFTLFKGIKAKVYVCYFFSSMKNVEFSIKINDHEMIIPLYTNEHVTTTDTHTSKETFSVIKVVAICLTQLPSIDTRTYCHMSYMSQLRALFHHNRRKIEDHLFIFCVLLFVFRLQQLVVNVVK